MILLIGAEGSGEYYVSGRIIGVICLVLVTYMREYGRGVMINDVSERSIFK